MDKKDIYEHLAKIYLDASSKKKKKTKYNLKSTHLIVVFLFSAAILSFGLYNFYQTHKERNTPLSDTSLFITLDAAKINFNFDPAKKETYSLDLNKLNLSGFKTVCFSVRKKDNTGKIALRVDMINSFKEKSEVYIPDIKHKWQDYKINLSEFKHINDFSEMQNITFSVEAWNTKDDKGVVYIDNVRFVR